MLLVKNGLGVQVFYGWLTRDEFNIVRLREEDFKASLKAALEKFSSAGVSLGETEGSFAGVVNMCLV